MNLNTLLIMLFLTCIKTNLLTIVFHQNLCFKQNQQTQFFVNYMVYNNFKRIPFHVLEN